MKNRTISRTLRVVSFALIFILLCSPLAVCASGSRAIVIPDPIVGTYHEELLFTLTAAEVHDFLRSSHNIVLELLPSFADGIYYCGNLYTTAYEYGNYEFRVGICYYDNLRNVHIPVTFYEPEHGEYFSYDETYVSKAYLRTINTPDFYGFVRNTFPVGTPYIHGQVCYYAVEEV